MNNWIENNWIRALIYVRKLKKYISEKIDTDRITSPGEESIIKLWDILLIDESTKIYSSFYGNRQIENGDIMIILQPSNKDMDFLVTYINIKNSQKICHESRFSQKNGDKMTDSFDDEIVKRMKKAEKGKRSIIELEIEKTLKELEVKYGKG